MHCNIKHLNTHNPFGAQLLRQFTMRFSCQTAAGFHKISVKQTIVKRWPSVMAAKTYIAYLRLVLLITDA